MKSLDRGARRAKQSSRKKRRDDAAELLFVFMFRLFQKRSWLRKKSKRLCVLPWHLRPGQVSEEGVFPNEAISILMRKCQMWELFTA